MTGVDVLSLITRYYDGCSTGDVEAMRATLHPEVVHYFLAPNPGSTPVHGDEHLARYWRKVAARIGARWVVDHALCGDCSSGSGEAVIEWTMFWCPPEADVRLATRGAEWFTVTDGLIREIRSYYRQQVRNSELEGFDYPGRGYSAAGSEASRLHRPAR